MRDESTLVAVGTGLAVIGLCTIPSLTGIISQLKSHEKKQDTYEDKDGKATPESVKAYSAKVPKALILLFAAAGSGVSIAHSILSKGVEGLFLENWLAVGAWAVLVFQAVVIASSRSSVQAYKLGIFSSLSALVLAGVLLAQGTRLAEKLVEDRPTLFALLVVDLAAAVALAIASLYIPRRPEVFYDGEPVDRMYTVSAFNRFNFAWPSALLSYATKKKNLDMLDLPRPDHNTRSAEMSADWKRRNYKHPLWLSVIRAHSVAFGLQWLGTLLASVLNFTPQWVLLQLLRNLERKEAGETRGVQIWVWVIWLAVAILAQSWVESYVFWLSWAELTVPVRAQLAALIFEKSLRRKDVKGVAKSKKKDVQPDGESEPATKPDAKESEEDESEELKKGKQSTVNLIGVDGKRVADFCAFQMMFPSSLFKLVVSLVFLITLLGWKPLLAGFSAMLAIMPINIYFSKKYSDAQDRLMKIRDEKTEVVTEALQGIRQIKFSALEPEWERKVGSVRERELSCIWAVFMADTALLACWVTSPVLLSAISLAVYAMLNGTLTPSVAFVSLGVFKALEVTLSVIPELTTDLLDAWVSIKRIEEYLNSAEVTRIAKDSEEVAFENATIAWPSDEGVNDEDRFVLRNVDVTFPKGELSVISGKTGTGKSLMLSAILGEVDLLGGNLYVPKAPPLLKRNDSKANKNNWIIPEAIAYVAQVPWIENASVKENITFGLPVDEERYNKTVEVCALKKDLEMMTDGENTEIGANGINLSGGQKWRVTLARAIYSRAGILVLDDIFSAVDAHVGRHIFEKCLNGELAEGRTRILVTHHVALCEPKTKYLVELGEGRVLNAGLVSELREEGALQKIKSHEQSQQEIDADETPTAVNSDGSSNGEDGEANGDNVDGDTLKKVTSKKVEARKFVEEESRVRGAIRKHVYMTYMKYSGGFSYWIFFLVFYASVQAVAVSRSWWLKEWTSDDLHENDSMFSVQTIRNSTDQHGYLYTFGVQQVSFFSVSTTNVIATSHHGFAFYLSIYVALAVVSSVLGTLKFLYVYVGSIRASRTLFAKLNFIILRAPLRWLDTVPVGRILNRFTSDFSIIDSNLANTLAFGVYSVMGLLGVVVSGFFVSPYIVLLAVVLLSICLHYAVVYLNAARPVKRLESTAKSPVFEQFGSALTGVATIRGFDKAEVYIRRMYRKIDDHSTTTWHLCLFNRWMGWRMALVGSLFASFVAALILATPGIGSALAGFALAFALEFNSTVVWTIRIYANAELNMNAAERIIEYTELPTEDLGGESPPAAWPTEGRIEVEDLVVSYASDLPPVLKGLSFSVNRNERVGVVGRTGAGKSSLTLALFRFLEAKSGSIHIDGLDISKIKLHDLRSRLAIIPQDPVLFSGTIRSNLDPFDHHTDAALRDCLERVHLITQASSGDATPTQQDASSSSPPSTIAAKNANVFENLDSPVSEGGLNLSQGQRQLLCLARAIVSRPRVMVLDEATSAVDMATDALIQRSIREEFTDATLLVIAHRLSTIADFDRILVLSDGRVAEFGSPRELWEKGPEEGIFRAMCEESGEKDKLKAIMFGDS